MKPTIASAIALVKAHITIARWLARVACAANDSRSTTIALISKAPALNDDGLTSNNLKPNHRVRAALDVHRIHKANVFRLGGHHQRMRSFAGTEKPNAAH